MYRWLYVSLNRWVLSLGSVGRCVITWLDEDSVLTMYSCTSVWLSASICCDNSCYYWCCFFCALPYFALFLLRFSFEKKFCVICEFGFFHVCMTVIWFAPNPCLTKEVKATMSLWWYHFVFCQQILPTAQRLLDELLSSQSTAINTVCGAPGTIILRKIDVIMYNCLISHDREKRSDSL